MASDIDICNLALGSLGEGPITSLATPTNQTERTCSRFYEIVKDNYLTEHDWSFCSTIVELTEETTEINEGYDWAPYKFTYPSDCLKARTVMAEGSSYPLPFVIRSALIATVDTKLIFTSIQEAFLEYTIDLAESYFSSPFVMALSKKIAYEIAWALTKDKSIRQQAYEQYLLADANAKQKDSSEQLPEANPITWEEARQGTFFGYTYPRYGLHY